METIKISENTAFMMRLFGYEVNGNIVSKKDYKSYTEDIAVDYISQYI